MSAMSRPKGTAIECSRCGLWTRVPQRVLLELTVPVLCPCCQADLNADVATHRPHVDMYARRESHMWSWTDDPIPPPQTTMEDIIGPIT